MNLSLIKLLSTFMLLTVPFCINAAEPQEKFDPIRPGGVNGNPFWNTYATQFLYPPSFAFKANAAAKEYRFTITDSKRRKHSFVSPSPTDALTPVWNAIPPGKTTVVCEAVDGSGKVLGSCGSRNFWRNPPFSGKYPPRRMSYREAAKRGVEWAYSYAPVQSFLTNTLDETYQLNCYPSKMIPAIIRIMIAYSQFHPENAATALRIAENAAQWMMKNSVKEPVSMRGLPITYFDYYHRTRHLGDPWDSKKIAHEQRNRIMMIYPANPVATSFIKLWEQTGKQEYFDYARNIADLYLLHQRENGTWPLLLEFPSGKALGKNFANPPAICRFLRTMTTLTKDEKYLKAALRAEACMNIRIDTFDWEGQFEDGAPQREKYRNPSFHTAIQIYSYMLDTYGAKYLSGGEEVSRWAEDQFVVWGSPARSNWYTPGVLEQYSCYVTIDGSYCAMLNYWLKLYSFTKNEIYRRKALALGDAITRNLRPDGMIPTVFPYDPNRAGRNWLNCMISSIETLMRLDAEVSGRTEK